MTVATILPNARTVFVDANSNPISGGSVYFYVPPNTTTLKTTWQDASGTIPNTNPVILDGDGSALIYGSGQYLQEVYDANDNLVWSGLTQDPYGLIVNGNNVWTGSNTFNGTTTFNGGFILPTNFVTNAMLANMQPNTVKVNNTATLGSPVDMALVANRLVGRGSTGNIAPISLGVGLTFSGSVLSATAGIVISKQIFTTSATYTPTTGMRYCIAEAVGGGGGGGGSSGGASAGGGSGAYCRGWSSAATIGVSEAVTIGAAGTGGIGGTGASTNGGNGGTTTFGTLLSAGGGFGGGPDGTNPAAGGVGGTANTGDLKINGASGSVGFSALYRASPSALSIYVSGAGANSQYGNGGAAVITSPNAGNPGVGYGAGGSGAVGNSIGVGNGGSGTAGIVIVTEFA